MFLYAFVIVIRNMSFKKCVRVFPERDQCPDYERREAPHNFVAIVKRNADSYLTSSSLVNLLSKSHKKKTKHEREKRKKGETREARREATYGGTKGNPGKNLPTRGWSLGTASG